MNTKRCTKCGAVKELGEFNLNNSIKGGHRGECRSCQKEYGKKYIKEHVKRRLEYLKEHKKETSESRRSYDKQRPNRSVYRGDRYKNVYGISREEFNKMVENQSGVCAICGKPERATAKNTGKTKCLSVDHDHSTGNVRGLLCSCCNTAIGHLRDDPNLLRKAASYLESFSEQGQI